MKKILLFLLRWFVCSLSLWMVVTLFGDNWSGSTSEMIATFLLAGLIFSIMNAIIKPIVTLFSMPFVIATVGLFTIIINGFMLWLTIAMVPNIHMSFGWAIVSGLIISMINYLMNTLTPDS